MNNKYFDKWEFQKAMSLMETDPYQANEVLKDYLQEYPKDYSIATYYISNLITIGRFNEAQHELNELEKNVKSDRQFMNQDDKVINLKRNILFARLKLLSYLEKYDEVYAIISKHPREIEKLDLNTFVYYCKSKLGKLDASKKYYKSYLYKQIAKYSEEDFREHIKKHLADYNTGIDDPNNYVFYASFPHEKILEEIKKYIPSDKRILPGIFENVYVFKYDSCGRANNKIVDYFKVVCFHNTRNIITVCPVSDAQNLPYIDLNYMVENENKVSKKMGQIEKFNKRFKRN